MLEFRIENDAWKARPVAKIHLLTWGVLVLSITTAALLFVLRALGMNADLTLRSLLVIAILVAVISANVLAFRRGIQRVEREMTFVLNDNEIIRKRGGWPDVSIAFSEIYDLRAESGWLVVQSTERARKIAIPKEVKGFEELQAELVKHHPLSASVGRAPKRFIVLPAISVLSWVAVVWFRDIWVVIPSATVALITLVFGSRRLWVLLHRGPKRLLMWVFLTLIWFSAIFLIYIRVVRP